MRNNEVDLSKVNNIDSKHDEEKRAKILHINILVEQAQNHDNKAMEELLDTFESLVRNVASKYYENNKSIVTWSEIYCFVRSMFVQLTLQDYTIGGDAHYNVFVKRMLNFRTLDYIERIIRNNKRNAPLTDSLNNIYIADDTIEEADDIIKRIYAQDVFEDILEYIDTYFDKREKLIWCDYCFGDDMTYAQLAEKYGISGPRISGIIKSLKKRLADFVESIS